MAGTYLSGPGARRRRVRAVAWLLLSLLAGCRAEEPPWTDEAYVWQRAWTPDVVAAVRDATAFDGLAVLVAEVTPDDPARPLVRPRVDWRALAEAGPQVTLVLRIGRFAGRFADRPALGRDLATLAADLVADARAAGLAPRELQVDYDAPERGLDDYATLWPPLRAALPPAVRSTFTALPSWLTHRRAFARLAASADGFVLQVHGLRHPLSADGPIRLLDPADARRAVRAAARFGRPFRVALPTYGYLIAFGADGGVEHVWAEDAPARPRTAARGTIRRVDSDPAQVADLVRAWRRARPRGLRGILWYRLPVAGDRLAWTRATLDAVRAGTAPLAAWRGAPQLSGDAAEVVLRNEGAHRLTLPARLELRWAEGALLHGDVAAPYRLERLDATSALLHLVPSEDFFPIAPAGRRTLAWLRFDRPPEGFRVSIP